MSTAKEQNATVGPPPAPVRFTVVVTAYNYARLLPDALRTLAAQTIQDFELLIVDDGSTDNTEEVVERFRPRFRNLRYLKKPHAGPADSRNVAARNSDGSHIAFLDADDMWSPHYLEKVQEALEFTPQAEMVLSNGLRIRDNGQVLHPVFPRRLPHFEGPVKSAENLFLLCSNFLPSGMVIRKSLYERIGPFDTQFDHGQRLGDDVEWFVRAITAKAYCVRIDHKMFLYRIHGGNLTTNPIDFLDPWLRIYEKQLKGSPLGPEYEREARNFTRNYVLRLLGICSPSEGRSLLTRALKSLQGDFILRCVYSSTYLGSTYALRPLKWGKRLIGKRYSVTQLVDLTAPPEMIFQSLQRAARP